MMSMDLLVRFMLVTNAEYRAMWGKILAVPFAVFAIMAVLAFLMEFAGTGSSCTDTVKALEEYQREYLGNKGFTYEGYVNGRCRLYIKEKDGRITKV